MAGEVTENLKILYSKCIQMPIICLDTILCTDRQAMHLKRDLEAEDLRSQSFQKVLLGILGRRNSRCKIMRWESLVSILEEMQQKRSGLGKVYVSAGWKQVDQITGPWFGFHSSGSH